MKCLLIIMFVMLALSAGIASCSPDAQQLPPGQEQEPEKPGINDTPGNGENNENNMSNKILLTAGTASFTIILEDNAATKAFKALLPMTVNMAEMNGNEKYYYLPENLPIATTNPGTIRTGDLMLFGSSCLVLFYESFSTSYSYTRMGRVDNAQGLAAALGWGSIQVDFELQ